MLFNMMNSETKLLSYMNMSAGNTMRLSEDYLVRPAVGLLRRSERLNLYICLFLKVLQIHVETAAGIG